MPKKHKKKKPRKRKANREPQTSKNPSKKDNSVAELCEEISELRFEDDFPDDIEEEVIHDPEVDGAEQSDEDESKRPELRVFRPGIDVMDSNEELQYDSTAYTLMHKLNAEWPCMSFDIIRDNFGEFRKTFPHKLYFACGSQADSKKNKVSLFKVTDIHKTKHDTENDDEEEILEDSDSDTEDTGGDPTIEEKFFEHPGNVNRLRCMPQSTEIIATWSDQGRVLLWDTKAYLRSFDVPPTAFLKRLKPIHDFSGHTSEGFAMDWSRLDAGRLLTGDCKRNIYLWEKTNAGWEVQRAPFRTHKDSVEDIQWSPTEREVFASCSVDKTICIWDARQRQNAALQIVAHEKDVNVISWNRINTSLLASGSDDNTFKIFDLRYFKTGNAVAFFSWHRGPITSIEWHPTEETVISCSSEDNSISMWDLSVEADIERPSQGAAVNQHELPPQLMFMHQGQTDIKEIHFHPQIPSLVISTAEEGFNIFKPDNL